MNIHITQANAGQPMAWHNFKNVGHVRGKFLAIHTPPVMEALIFEIGQPIDDPLNPPVPAGPPSEEQQQRMMAMFQKYMEMLPADAIAG
jgi:hypothetical protein